MKFGQLLVVLLTLVIVIAMFSSVNVVNQTKAQETVPDVYVGIDMGFTTDVPGVKSLIDQVCNYTNFFVMGASAISMNLTNLNATLQYAYDKGMYFMSFPPTLGYSADLINRSKAWINYSQTAWGDHLKGFMYPYEDEPGGHTLDRNGQYRPSLNITTNTSLADVEAQYINSSWFRDVNRAKSVLNTPLFTSDYSLYWFDYRGGYDGLFAEFGWNKFTNINVALCRGAATVLDKQWGVIITYQYNSPPYMENGTALYDDLLYAYDNGAKYIVVLDTNVNWTAGILTQEHFDALQRFWQYIHENPRKAYPVTQRVAYVLPQGFAYGFRGPDDNIWGVWPVNMTAFMVSTSVAIMLGEYGSKLDIIYDESIPGSTYEYSKVVLWNDPTAVASAWPSFWPGLTPTPTPIPTPTPTNSPTLIPETPTPSPSSTTTNSPNITLSTEPTPSSEGKQPLVPEYVYALVLVVGVCGFGLLIVRKRFRTEPVSGANS
jgi:hypothetical protein